MKGALWCVVLCAVLGIATADDPVGICGLDGFDLNVLHLGTYWNFTEPKPTQNCLHEGDPSLIESCVVYFSICKPLPNVLCDANNVSYCQVVKYKNGSKTNYIIGNYSTKHDFFAHSEGFGAIRSGAQYKNEAECNETNITTDINFHCDPDAKYDIKKHDLSQYIDVTERADCALIYNLKYSGACYQQPTLAPSHCSLSGFDTTAISKPGSYFTAEVPKTKCFNFTTNCTIVMSFCHPLPLNISDHCRNPESAICQTNKLVKANESWSMGAYSNYTRFHEYNDTSEVGFYVQYTGGSKPDGADKCNSTGITTNVIFTCNKEAVWNKQDVTFYVNVVPKKQECGYDILAEYEGACYKADSSSDVRTSYIGWIFIGIFLFFVVTYLVVGSAFQYIVRKERGLKVIPNFDFWRNFLILTVEGCKFSLDAITCHRFSGTPRSMNYDQL